MGRCLAALEKCGKKVVAWGEFGLDYSNQLWGEDEAYRQEQRQVFERQIEIALSKELPMVLHIRDASEDAMKILKRCVPTHWKAHVHSFLGSAEFIQEIIDHFPNFFFGLSGTVSMGLDGDGARMGRTVPLDRVLLETDAPYMAPRGTVLNHCGQIPLIARLVAKFRDGVTAEEVGRKARANTRFVYGI